MPMRRCLNAAVSILRTNQAFKRSGLKVSAAGTRLCATCQCLLRQLTSLHCYACGWQSVCTHRRVHSFERCELFAAFGAVFDSLVSHAYICPFAGMAELQRACIWLKIV